MSIKSGYFKRSLHVDLSAGRCERQKLSDEFLEQYVGGRGFGAKMVWDHLVRHDFRIDPLGPENLIVIAPGPLTGAYLPASGKCSFVAISPATGVYGDSSMGGTLASSSARQGSTRWRSPAARRSSRSCGSTKTRPASFRCPNWPARVASKRKG